MSLPGETGPQMSMGPSVFPEAIPQQVEEGERQERREGRFLIARATTATGWLATGLLGLTLLVGPANLVLHGRSPVSSYVARDLGAWAALLSVVHVIFGLTLHTGSQLSGIVRYFVVDGRPLLNSFGLGNWTGLVALVIVAMLFALSNDAALRELKAKPWKDLQRLNYTLFALVIIHAFFYGALLRLTSPFTLLGIATVVAVVIGQALGIWAWRRRHSRRRATLA